MSEGNKAMTTDQSISEIDRALQAAKARQAAKGQTSNLVAAPEKPETKKPRLTDEERAAKAKAAEELRAAKKAQRDAERAERQAAKAVSKAPAHLKKVNAAAARLSPLGQAASLLFAEATTNLPASELAALASQIMHFNRIKATERALTTKVSVGQRVTIVTGDPRFIGKVGTVSKAQRIRAYVTVEGQAKPYYCFTSDLQPLVEEPAAVAAG